MKVMIQRWPLPKGNRSTSTAPIVLSASSSVFISSAVASHERSLVVAWPNDTMNVPRTGASPARVSRRETRWPPPVPQDAQSDTIIGTSPVGSKNSTDQINPSVTAPLLTLSTLTSSMVGMDSNNASTSSAVDVYGMVTGVESRKEIVKSSVTAVACQVVMV